jgi:Ca-activated chloride channel family protein
MQLHSPWALMLVIPVAAILAWRHIRPSKQGSLHFSFVKNAARSGRSLRQRLALLPTIIRVLALLCLIIAIARPQTGQQQIRDTSRGVAIEMVVDRSGSMGAEMAYQGQTMTRLDVVKKLFLDFVLGNGDTLPGRPNDLIGMISYARYPDTVCPLTLAHGALPLFVKNTQRVHQKSEDGTAIGDALALAAARLKTAEADLKKSAYLNKSTYHIKSKIVILLSDGVNNTGKRTPSEAAQLAKKWGIKVYTIAVGGGESMASVRTPFGVFKMPGGVEVDLDTLKSIAKTTGGLFYEAGNAESLNTIYQKIDALETSEIASVRYLNYREDFLPFALAAFILISLEIIMRNTLFRKAP